MKIQRLKFLSLFALTFYTSVSQAQEVSGNSVTYSSTDGDLRIEMCSETMFRVMKSVADKQSANEKWMVENYDFPEVKYQVMGNEITTDSLRIKVSSSPWRIQVSNSKGTVLYQEIKAGYRDSIYNAVAMNPDEHFFGFGERMDQLDQRGQRIHLNVELGSGVKPAVGGKDILRANYCPVPLMLSNIGYGVFFHTAVPNDWDMGWTRNDQYSFSAPGGNNDYYFIYGPTVQEMLRSYQSLTGVAPLMPKVAYGLHIGSYSGGTWHHESEASGEYVVNLVDRLRQERIPFDLMWLDSTWRLFAKLGNGGCTFEFQESFKDPKAMIDHAYQNHVGMFGLHIRSLVDNGKRNTLLTTAQKKGFTIQDGETNAIINFFDDKAVDWWWKNAAKKVTDVGVRFFKTDVGSALRYKPANIEQMEQHNLFPIAYAKAPYEHFAKLNGQRGFDHTREGYAGIQRYPFIWAGDWGSEWQWFEPIIRGGMNIGLSGVGYWSHCMGGFEQYSDYDTDLYLRWCQMGMFSPVAMLFGMDHPRYHEPWTYGEKAQKIFIQYDSLRYSLMPYIYTAAWQMYKTSRPMMTPLLFDHLQDHATYQISNQYMFGRDIMVCPVTVKNALSRPVYFPGGDWVDFWTGERIHGRQHKSFLTPIEIMPIFIKRGAIIPQQEPMQYIDERPNTELSLLIYPSEHSSYELYEDDGKSMDYQQGGYALTRFESTLSDSRWQLTVAKPTGTYQPIAHQYKAVVYLDRKPNAVILNGTATSNWTYNEKLRRLELNDSIENGNITVNF